MPDLPRVGEEFGSYRLGPRLGRGGMSVVFQAENWRLGNVVALKILAPDLANDDNFRMRFLQESRIAAGFNHPHVVPILDSGAYDGLLYIAMRYVAGTDLRQMIAEQRWLDAGIAVHLLSQAALAIDAAHRHGLVHRDVKPANLLVERTSDDADPDHLYLADFGISKHVGRPSMFGGLTTAGTVMGTALYLAPEQAQELAVGGAADQYALGCVLYECLTGRGPFEKGSGHATLIAHVEEPPPAATTFRSDLPPAIDQVFARVLAKHPDQRYPTCRAFMAAAADALEVPGWLPGGGRSSEFQSAPPPARFPAPGPDPAEQQWPATEDLTPAERPLGPWEPPGAAWPQDPGTFRDAADDGGASGPPGVEDWSFYPADGRQARTRRVRSGRNSWIRRNAALVSVLAVAVLAGAAGGGWYLARAHATERATTPTRPAAVTRPASSPPASELFSVLEQTAKFVPSGDLNLSGCTRVSKTDVECAHPSAAIGNVSFVTYPSLSTLYLRYKEILAGRTIHEPFAGVENKGECSGVAPEPTDESTWNHSGGTSDNYSVEQLVSGAVPTDIAMGRVFCKQLPNGSEIIVWTNDDGDFLGYATGVASHEQVYNWWWLVHHQIIFPDETGMSRTMPMSPPAASGSASP